MALWHKTDCIRGPAGEVLTATGTGLLVCAACASNPPGWVIGTGAVLAEAGIILQVSDLDVWGLGNKVVAPMRRKEREREEQMEEILRDIGWGSDKNCPQKETKAEDGTGH